MTVRENIQIFHQFEIEAYLEILKSEHGAKEHPNQPGCYLADDLPFYKPRQINEHVSVLGFNLVPLPGVLLDAIANHPEFVPDETKVIWTIEQDLLLDTTMREIRSKESPS